MRQLDNDAVREAYAGWAPLYDATFGLISWPGRKLAVKHLSLPTGRVLEIGVGTGLSLPLYPAAIHVTGIDLSMPMLERAKARVTRGSCRNVNLSLMDAGVLAFPDACFEAVAAMYVMTVVPNAGQVMREIGRVLKPGGEAVIVNHFSQDHGLRGAFEKGLARYSRRLGWHPIFPVEALSIDGLNIVERVDLPPFGLFSLIRLRKAI